MCNTGTVGKGNLIVSTRTENHSGKFDIFIIFYVLRKFSTCFHFFYVRPRRARASNTCELMFFAHMWTHAATCTCMRLCVSVCLRVCVCVLRKCVQAENAHSLIYFMLEICTFCSDINWNTWRSLLTQCSSHISIVKQHTHTLTYSHTCTVFRTHTNTRPAVKSNWCRRPLTKVS